MWVLQGGQHEHQTSALSFIVMAILNLEEEDQRGKRSCIYASQLILICTSRKWLNLLIINKDIFFVKRA